MSEIYFDSCNAVGRVVSDYMPVSVANGLRNYQQVDNVGDMSTGDTWLDGFVDWLRAGGVSDATVKLRITYVRAMLVELGDPPSITAAGLASWLARPGWKPNTRRVAQVSARTFFHWALDAGLIEADPSRSLRSVTVPRGLPRPAPEDAIEAALAEADETLRLAILLAAFAGLRRAEIARLHADDIAADSILVTGKGGHKRRVPIAGRLVAPLAAVRLRGGWAFPSPRRLGQPVRPDTIGEMLSKVLPEGFSGHTLRHRFGTQVYRGSHDIRATQQLLGHASIATTQLYVEVSEDSLAAAIANL